MPIFSIITIAYNSASTIERTIKSVLDQGCKDYEYIIVDGASKDSTLEIIKTYEPLFEGRLKWRSEPDKGIYDAMNKGVLQSSGDIIGIVNSDDWLELDTLERVKNVFQENGRDTNTLYCGGINFVTPAGIKKMSVNFQSFRKQALLYVMSGVRHPGVFVPKDVYEKIGTFNSELQLSADQDFILRCYYGGVNFYDMKAIVSNMAEGGLSTGGGEKARRMSIEDRKKMLKCFGIKGIKFQWLMTSWTLRNRLRNLLVTLRLYK